MCGITGYVGRRDAVRTAVESLKRLEYRGYDSAGVAYPNCRSIRIIRAAGKIANLEYAMHEQADEPDAAGGIAIAHTRWATHGRPTAANAHPHADCTGRIAVVHNGIIENHDQLRRRLIGEGHEFVSDTDTEVISHLIESEYAARSAAGSHSPELAMPAAIRAATDLLEGSYALAVIAQDVPDTVFAARKHSPLVLGLGSGENFLASDISALISFTRRVVQLEDGDIAQIRMDSVEVFDSSGDAVVRAVTCVTWDDELAEKGGHPHFMLKEIFDGPRTVRETLRGRLRDGGEIEPAGFALDSACLRGVRRLAIVACGTAYHAGLVGKRMIEQALRVPVDASVASEFRYSDPIVDEETLVVLISQSGETADTLAAMREARSKGAYTLAVVNVAGSTLAREADAVMLTQAGPEIGVASTKAYLAQLTALALLCLYLGEMRVFPGGVDGRRVAISKSLHALPDLLEISLERCAEIESLAKRLSNPSGYFFLGRGYDYATAMEAALKLKEISYLHAEAYAAGEMKHGPLALVEPGVTVIGICTQEATREKMISNLQEVKAREACVVGVLRDSDPGCDTMDHVIRVPDTEDALMPLVTMASLQLLAYYIANERGCEIDQPRNLAKSVTVE